MKAFKIICNNLTYLKEKMEWNQNSKEEESEWISKYKWSKGHYY